MLRQRNIGRGDEVVGEGIFIGDVEEPVGSSKERSTGQSEGDCWKYLSLLMIAVTVLSLGLNVYQFKLIGGYQRDIQELNETHQNVHSEWTADRNNVEECRSEMHEMETHMNNRETENLELEKVLKRLRRSVSNRGTMENPPTPHPEQGYPSPPNHHSLEEQQRQQLEEQRQDQEKEQKRQIEEQQRQSDELRQQELQRHQEELERQQEVHRQQEAQRQQEEQQREQEEQQRQQEEQQRQQEQQKQQQEEQQRQQDELRKQQEEQRQQQEQRLQQEEHQIQLEEQQRQQQAQAEAQQHQEE